MIRGSIPGSGNSYQKTRKRDDPKVLDTFWPSWLWTKFGPFFVLPTPAAALDPILVLFQLPEARAAAARGLFQTNFQYSGAKDNNK